MPLDPTTGGAASNTYSTREAALARAALDVRGTTFVAAGEAKQDQFLAMATLDIDGALLGSGRLIGARADAAQALEYPHAGETTIPRNLEIATQLHAFHLAERESLGEVGTPQSDLSNVKEDTVEGLTTVYFEPGQRPGTPYEQLPAHVRAYLEPFLRSARPRWGQGRAVRVS